jgi:hypothetical protein
VGEYACCVSVCARYARKSASVFSEIPASDSFVETGYWGGGTDNADRLLRRKAAEIGCDALVVQGYVQGGARYRAICLAYEN